MLTEVDLVMKIAVFSKTKTNLVGGKRFLFLQTFNVWLRGRWLDSAGASELRLPETLFWLKARKMWLGRVV